MTHDKSGLDPVSVAAAFDWRVESLAALLESEALQAEVRELCIIGSDLRVADSTSEGFEARVAAALRTERAIEGLPSPTRTSRGIPRSAARSLGVAGAAVGAALTTLFALLTTGAYVGNSPLPVLVASAIAGGAVAITELTDLKDASSAIAPRNSWP